MNKLRFRSGQVQLHKFRVDEDTIIEAGDLVYLDTGVVKPASEFTWTTDLPTTQGSFAAQFAGIAHEPSPAGEDTDISIDVSPTSIYEFDVAASTFEVGDLLGPDETSGALHGTQLEKVGSSAAAISRAAEYRTSLSNSLRVSFASAIHTASANVNASVG